MNNIVGFDDYNKIKAAFDKAKSKVDLLKLLGVENYSKMSSSNLNKLLQKYADVIDFDLNSIIKRDENSYNKNPKLCKQCKEPIPYKKRNNEFCSQSCATKYNNSLRGPKTEEEKEKISRTLLKHFNWSDEDIDKLKSGELKKTRKNVDKVCPTCHKEFKGKPNQIYCSQKCVHNSPDYKEKMRNKQLELIKKGKHKGWITRNIDSYAEKYWMDVLDNNNIKYIREDHTNKKYFLDFLIEKNGNFIDLEIDGKQHKEPDRLEHDKERDEYITTELGFIVYRIPWNEVNTEKGRAKMKEKIDKFFEFYNSL